MAKSKAKNIGVWIILGLLFVGLMGAAMLFRQHRVQAVLLVALILRYLVLYLLV